MGVKIELSRNEIDIVLNGLSKELKDYQEKRKKATPAKKKILDQNFSSTKNLYKFFQGV